VLRLDAERLELGRKLAEMEGLKRSVPTLPLVGKNSLLVSALQLARRRCASCSLLGANTAAAFFRAELVVFLILRPSPSARLHIGELEARNRAMISELDTARMELDNKIREKRELMQAHAAYVEEMERQHALRVDELDTLVQQYRATIWQYEAKVEGLEKELDGHKKSSAPRALPDMSQFEATGAEDADELRSKNEQLLAEYEAVVGDLSQAEGQRDASKREVSMGSSGRSESHVYDRECADNCVGVAFVPATTDPPPPCSHRRMLCAGSLTQRRRPSRLRPTRTTCTGIR